MEESSRGEEREGVLGGLEDKKGPEQKLSHFSFLVVSQRQSMDTHEVMQTRWSLKLKLGEHQYLGHRTEQGGGIGVLRSGLPGLYYLAFWLS